MSARDNDRYAIGILRHKVRKYEQHIAGLNRRVKNVYRARRLLSDIKGNEPIVAKIRKLLSPGDVTDGQTEDD